MNDFQVIHHLPMEATGEFTGVKKFIKESYRILKEQGMLIINTSSPEQTQKCWIGTGASTRGRETGGSQVCTVYVLSHSDNYLVPTFGKI